MFRKILFIAGLLGSCYSPPKPRAAGAPLTNRSTDYTISGYLRDHYFHMLSPEKQRSIVQSDINRYLHDDDFTISRDEASKVIRLNPAFLRRYIKEDFIHVIRLALCGEQDARSNIRLEEMIELAKIEEKATANARAIRAKEATEQTERLEMWQEAKTEKGEAFAKFGAEIQTSREYVNLKNALRSLIDNEYGIIHAKLSKLGATLYALESESNARKIYNIILSLSDRILGIITSQEHPELFLDFENSKYYLERLLYYIKQIDLVNLEGTMLGDILTKITNPKHTIKSETQAYLDELQDIIRKTQVFSNAMMRLESLYMPHSMNFNYSSMLSAGMMKTLHQRVSRKEREIMLSEDLAELLREMSLDPKSDPDTQAPAAAAAAEEETVSDYTLPTNVASSEATEFFRAQLEVETGYSKELEDKLAEQESRTAELQKQFDEYKRRHPETTASTETHIPTEDDLFRLSKAELQEHLDNVSSVLSYKIMSEDPRFCSAPTDYKPADDGAASESTPSQQDIMPPKPAGLRADSPTLDETDGPDWSETAELEEIVLAKEDFNQQEYDIDRLIQNEEYKRGLIELDELHRLNAMSDAEMKESAALTTKKGGNSEL